MKSIIKKLYWGEVMPCKEPSPNTQKYKDTKAHLDQVESEILKQFPALSNDLDEYRETMWNMAALESEEDFIRGFRLVTANQTQPQQMKEPRKNILGS